MWDICGWMGGRCRPVGWFLVSFLLSIFYLPLGSLCILLVCFRLPCGVFSFFIIQSVHSHTHTHTCICIFDVGVLPSIKEEWKKGDEILPIETKILSIQSNWKILNTSTTPHPFALNYAWKFHF